MIIGLLSHSLLDYMYSPFHLFNLVWLKSKKRSQKIDNNLIDSFLQSGGDDGYYNCEDIPFFEIGNVYYEQYLVNIRLPSLEKNNKIGKITDVNFVVSQY